MLVRKDIIMHRLTNKTQNNILLVQKEQQRELKRTYTPIKGGSVYTNLSNKLYDNKDVYELIHEHNWRNKNESKRKKRSYFDTRPDRDAPGFNIKRLTFNVLQNENTCSIVGNKSCKIIIKNVCGFDSIVHILATACRNNSFHQIIESAESGAFKLINTFLKNGPYRNVY